MLDHIILTVSDIERSLKFYKSALKPLKIKMFIPYKGTSEHPDLWGFGDGEKAFFWLKVGTPYPESIHWGFVAESNSRPQELIFGEAVGRRKKCGNNLTQCDSS
jgi:catechol 2,3-dioxygenase-like lactoylglutathione lyase family enzyme